MLIKCPECNQTVSDKAEVCPHCGIRLNSPSPALSEGRGGGTPVPPTDGGRKENGGGKGHKGLIISFIIALILTGVGYYFYNDAQKQKEQEAYETAMLSGDEMVMQNYLGKYMDAPREHRDSVNARLAMLNEEANEWENAVNSGTRSALVKYMEQNPASPHMAEAKDKIDSIDYAKAERDYRNGGGAAEPLKKYIAEHPDGRYASKVQEILDEIKAKQLTPEDIAMARDVCKRFFQAINARNEGKLLLTITDNLVSFLNHGNATSSDVVAFMNRLYKEDITNMNWHILDNFKAEKVVTTDADGNTRYDISVQFGAEQHIERTDPGKETLGRYIVTAEISPEGKITKMGMKKFKQGEQ